MTLVLVSSRSIAFLSVSSLHSTRICLEEPSVVPYQWVISESLPQPRNLLLTICIYSDSSDAMTLIPLSPQMHHVFFPAKFSTIHALGIFSSEVRPPETPATVTSLMSFSGCSRRQFSISTGDTCAPETFSVSYS